VPVEKKKTIKTGKNNFLKQFYYYTCGVVGGGIPQDLPLDLRDGPKGDFGGPA
jgi:hypothetical protein